MWQSLVTIAQVTSEFRQRKKELEKAAQGVAQCQVSATRVVVDAALLCGGKSRRGGHRIANIISPVIVDGFKNGFHQWIQRMFLVVAEAI